MTTCKLVSLFLFSRWEKWDSDGLSKWPMMIRADGKAELSVQFIWTRVVQPLYKFIHTASAFRGYSEYLELPGEVRAETRPGCTEPRSPRCRAPRYSLTCTAERQGGAEQQHADEHLGCGRGAGSAEALRCVSPACPAGGGAVRSSWASSDDCCESFDNSVKFLFKVFCPFSCFLVYFYIQVLCQITLWEHTVGCLFTQVCFAEQKFLIHSNLKFYYLCLSLLWPT